MNRYNILNSYLEKRDIIGTGHPFVRMASESVYT